MVFCNYGLQIQQSKQDYLALGWANYYFWPAGARLEDGLLYSANQTGWLFKLKALQIETV